jgi:hypothetical protein
MKTTTFQKAHSSFVLQKARRSFNIALLRGLKWRLIAIVAVLTISSTVLANGQASSFSIKVRKPADKVELVPEGKATTINVLSSDGIGSATLTRTGGQWPQKMVIRFNLKNLESIRLSDRTQFLAGRLGSDQWRQEPKENPVAQASIRKTGATIEVDVPDILLKSNPAEIVIEWINEYRQ